MSLKKTTIPVKGMHCRSCEMLIEQNLSEIKGIKKSEASHKKGKVEIEYSSEELDMDKVEKAVREAGYGVGENEPAKLVAGSNDDYRDLGIAALFLLAIYLFAKSIGVADLNFVPSADSYALPVVLMVGLAAGFSTCMALVGGLVLGMSARHKEKHPEASAMQNFRPHLFFNAGRIFGYALLGGLLGAIGSALQLSAGFLGLLTLAVGIIMLVLGMKLVGIFPWLENFSFALPKGVGRFFGINQHEREYSHKGSFLAGALTFFLPCGFTQAMQLLAISTGSFLQGALIMGVFALGTAPGLLGIGGLTSAVKGAFAKRFFKFAGLVVAIMALFNISNGYNLLSISAGSERVSSGERANSAVQDANGNVQVIKMTENSRGYSPNRFTVKKGVPVRWEITADDPYSCASSLIAPKIGVKKTLKKGLNVIEFVPTESGTIPFSCSMGMYTGMIIVTDEASNVPTSKAQEETSPVGEQEAQEYLPPASCH